MLLAGSLPKPPFLSFWLAAAKCKTDVPAEHRAPEFFLLLREASVRARFYMQADACVSALNELQSILGVPRVPTLKELHDPATKHTLRHLTTWLNPWLQLYELMPQLIHPDSDTVGDGASSEAGTGAANGVDEDKSASVEEGKEASSTDKKSKDRRVRLTYQQAQQVCCTLLVNEALLEHCVPCKMVLQP
jgi:hypothetical protein